jgi:hypothetical protein
MRRGDPAWPPHNPEHWECTAGLDCDEGWFVWRGNGYVAYPKTGGAETAERCPCQVKNIRDRQRRKHRGEGDW